MARAFPVDAVRALRGAHRGGTRHAGRRPDAAWKAFRTADRCVRARWPISWPARGQRQARGRRRQRVRCATVDRAAAAAGSPRAESAGPRRCHAEVRREIAEARAARRDPRAQEPMLDSSRARCRQSLREVPGRLPADTRVLAYFVGDETSHAWMLAHDTLKHATLALPSGRAAARRMPSPRPAAAASAAARLTRNAGSATSSAHCSNRSPRNACW